METNKKNGLKITLFPVLQVLKNTKKNIIIHYRMIATIITYKLYLDNVSCSHWKAKCLQNCRDIKFGPRVMPSDFFKIRYFSRFRNVKLLLHPCHIQFTLDAHNERAHLLKCHLMQKNHW